MTPRFSRKTLEEALAELGRRDPDLARAHREAGLPALRKRAPGFSTFVDIILAQQLSAASANAIRARLKALATLLSPASFLALDDASLRGIGFSRQKILYGRGLAEALASRRLDLRHIHRLPDEEAIAAITSLKGLGRWSAEVYLAVVVAVQRLKRLKQRPDRKRMLAIAEPWRPWRSYAARLLWHYYRNAPG
jgi:DNA-3-methyladenine glycosylase II